MLSHTSQLDTLITWRGRNSLHYLLFGLACCGIELMQTGGPRADLDRFGAVFRATPRQSDLMIVAGTLTYKMAVRTKLLYDQMAEPQVRDLHGVLRQLRRPLPARLLGVRGRRQDDPGRRLRPGLPAAPRGAHRGAPEAAGAGAAERWHERWRDRGRRWSRRTAAEPETG